MRKHRIHLLEVHGSEEVAHKRLRDVACPAGRGTQTRFFTSRNYQHEVVSAPGFGTTNGLIMYNRDTHGAIMLGESPDIDGRFLPPITTRARFGRPAGRPLWASAQP